MRSRESFVINCRTFNISDERADWDSSKRRSGVSPSLRSELASEYPDVSMTLCPSSSRTDRAKDRVIGLAVTRTMRSCFTCTSRERHSVVTMCGMSRTIEPMWDESSHRLTFPDGQSFASADPLSSRTELRPGCSTEQRDRASPRQSHLAERRSFAYGSPRGF